MITYSKAFALALFRELTASVLPSAPIVIAGSAPMSWYLGNSIDAPGDIDIFVNSPEAYRRTLSKLSEMTGAVLPTGGSFTGRPLEHIVETCRSRVLGVNLIHTQLPESTNVGAYVNNLFDTFDCDIAQVALTRSGSYIRSEEFRRALNSGTISFDSDALPARVAKYSTKFSRTAYEVIV